MAKNWTFMVYMAGDNNLESFGHRDLEEMKAAGSSHSVDIVVQFDRMSDGATRRYHISKDRSIIQDTVAELGETNTGDPQTLLDFIRWGLREYPAEKNALVLWNHGSGWKDNDIYAAARRAGLSEAEIPRSLIRSASIRPVGRSLFTTSVNQAMSYPAEVRAILFDDTSKDFLDNQELKGVLDEVVRDGSGRKLDLLGFDACLMNMVEVGYQIRPGADYMVGSQEVEPGDGWPYDRILNALSGNPAMDAASLANSIVEAYSHHYAQSETGVTQSSVRLDRAKDLAEGVTRLADLLTERLPDPNFYGRTLMSVMRKVQQFRDKQYCDLAHFAQLISEIEQDTDIRRAAADVWAMLDASSPGSAVTASWATGPETDFAKGLSIYLPFYGAVSPAYSGLEFARDSSWDRFLTAFSET